MGIYQRGAGHFLKTFAKFYQKNTEKRRSGTQLEQAALNDMMKGH